MSFTYKANFPQNQKTSYQEFDSVDFLLAGSDSIVLNSIRIEGKINVAGTTNKRIFYDGMTGMHNAFASMTVETQRSGVIEHIDSYGRMVKMMRIPVMKKEDLMSSAYIPELCLPNDYLASQKLEGVIPYNHSKTGNINGNFQALDNDFSIKPMICLNRASGEGVPLLDLQKEGYVKVNVKLARVFELLYGEDVNTNTEYTLSDLRITYRAVMEKPQGAVQMRTIATFKSAVQSNLNNVSARVPAVANSVLVSFIPQDREQTATHNNLACHEIPNIKFIDWVYNDNTNAIITYQDTQRVSILDKAMSALQATGKHTADPKYLKSNDSFLIGLNFGQFIDWSQNKLSVNMSSDVSSANPYAMYFMFNGVQEL